MPVIINVNIKLYDCFNEQYLRKFQSARHHGDGVGSDSVKMADTGSGSWWRSASWTSVVHIVLVTGRQMSPLDDSSEVYVKFKFANERYKTRVRLTSLITRLVTPRILSLIHI